MTLDVPEHSAILLTILVPPPVRPYPPESQLLSSHKLNTMITAMTSETTDVTSAALCRMHVSDEVHWTARNLLLRKETPHMRWTVTKATDGRRSHSGVDRDDIIPPSMLSREAKL
jgi:hypothetical protein